MKNKPKLILTIGIPAAGKSEILGPFAKKHGYEYLCLDEIREEYNIGRENPIASTGNQKMIEVWDEMRKRMKNCLSEGKTVVVDATFASTKLRTQFIKLAKESGAQKIQGVFIDTSTETAWQRNLQRPEKTPERVFKDRVEMIQKSPPHTMEGFDTLCTISELEKEIKIETQEGRKREFSIEKIKSLN